MRKYLQCVECVFILTLCVFSAFAEDASASANISADTVPETESDTLIGDLEPSADFVANKPPENVDTFQRVFVEATSQNSGVANEITTGGQPVVVTLQDAATAELQQRAILPSQDANENSQTNQTGKVPDPPGEINQSRSEPTQQTEKIDVLSIENENLTEEIPSFSEWAQKQLEEAEKNKEASNASTQNQNINGKQTKHRWKNYASLDCGAKVVASNPEAVSPSAILSPSRDEYKLNTCTSRIWFIVELCEAIQAKKIDFANFELFSSSPKDFVVSVSDRFPTREWSNVGQFTAKDERDIQSFDLDPQLFAKYIKVEVKSHYGSEHYCPISLFRVYGTSEFEVLQKEDAVHANQLEDDEDDDESLDEENGDASKNLFSSATDAVISMVKKAAEVLGNKGNYSNQTEILNNTEQVVPLVRICTSPSHLIVCDNCSDALFGQVYELLSCEDANIRALSNLPLIRRFIAETHVCKKFGLGLCKVTEPVKQSKYLEALFPDRLVAAMCNMVAVFQNKVVLNVSNLYSNDTVTDDIVQSIEMSEPSGFLEPEITDALTLEVTDAITKSTCSTDVMYTSQIKPTKTLVFDLDVRDSVTESSPVATDDVKSTVTASETVQSNLSEVVAPEVGEYVETVTESGEVLEDPLEHFMEFNGDAHQLPNPQTTASTTPQIQKESVFLRLSNRIKALERNMSLSGQYLEELSKRYKKQVEEIQKLLDKTILRMNEESKKKDERNKQLEERLIALTATVESLVAERRSWYPTVYCVIVSSLVTLFIVTFCCRVPEPIATRSPEPKRRKSIDVVRQPAQKKRRRPSDQALKIVRSSLEQDSWKKKKKKKQLLKRSNSIGTLNEDKTSSIWNRQESAPAEAPVDWVEGKHLEEVPFVLEESEHSSLEPLALAEGGKIAAPVFLKTALNSRAVRVNGDVARIGDVGSRSSVNGNVGFGGDGTPKKERKGLRKIFKRMF